MTLAKPSRRVLVGLISSISFLFGVAVAQQPTVQEQRGGPQETGLVVPPEPLIIKKSVASIWIPPQAVDSLHKYRDRSIASHAIWSASTGNAVVGSSYGYRRDPFTRRARFHSGLDIKARLGDAVAASHAGIVQYTGWYHGYGNWVVIDHGGGVTTHYAHLSGFAVEVGEKVKRGSLIGFAGSTGRATSPHLHYEVRINGTPVNPLQPVALDAESDYFRQPDKAKEVRPSQPSSRPEQLHRGEESDE